METGYSHLPYRMHRSSHNGNLPDVLQAGSPVSQHRLDMESAFPLSHQPSPRPVGPQIVLPERPRARHQYSVSSLGSDDSASKRFSLPTAFQPATQTVYGASDSLLPSSLASIAGSQKDLNSEYCSVKTRSALPSRLASTRSMLGGLMSPRSPGPKRFSWLTANDDYSVVEERHEVSFPVKKRRFGVEDFHESEMDRTIGYDISSLGGPICLQQFSPSGETISDMQTQGTLAAEYHQLEAGGKLTGGLGGGMVVGAKLQVDTNSSAVGSRFNQLSVPSTGGIVRGNTVRDVGQREAKERGEIVAIKGRYTPFETINLNLKSIETMARVDLSSLGGVDHAGTDSDSYGNSLHRRNTTDQDKQSYFYPAGKQRHLEPSM